MTEIAWIIIASIVTLGWIVLVIYLVFTLRAVQHTLETTKEIAEGVQSGVDAIQPLFQATSLLSDEVLHSVKKWKGASASARECAEEESDPAKRAALISEWAMLSLYLYKNFIKRRK